jgi:hypothetical protein
MVMHYFRVQMSLKGLLEQRRLYKTASLLATSPSCFDAMEKVPLRASTNNVISASPMRATSLDGSWTSVNWLCEGTEQRSRQRVLLDRLR